MSTFDMLKETAGRLYDTHYDLDDVLRNPQQLTGEDAQRLKQKVAILGTDLDTLMHNLSALRPEDVPALTPMTQEAYRAAGGGCCPVCQSTHIAGKSFDTESGLVSQPCVCQDCNTVWTDMYRLAGYVRKNGADGEDDYNAFLDTQIVDVPED